MVQIKKDGRHVTVKHPREIASADVLGEIFQKYEVSDIFIQGPQIEDVVMKVYNS